MKYLMPDQIERLLEHVCSICIWIEFVLFFLCVKLGFQALYNATWVVDMWRGK